MQGGELIVDKGIPYGKFLADVLNFLIVASCCSYSSRISRLGDALQAARSCGCSAATFQGPTVANRKFGIY